MINEKMMEEKLKKYYGFFAMIIFFFLAMAIVAYISVYSRSVAPNRTFAVTGEGKVTATPDIASLSLGVLTEGGKDLASLAKDNNNKINNIIGSLKGKGVQDSDIATQVYNIIPRYQYFACNASASGSTPCPPAEIVGYSVSQNVTVKIRDIKKAGDIVNGVVGSGANTVSGLSFFVDDLSPLQDQAREKAIVRAKEIAGLIAASGGFSLGKIASVQEGISNPAPVAIMDKSGFGGGSAPIESGSQDISATVTLVYEIQ